MHGLPSHLRQNGVSGLVHAVGRNVLDLVEAPCDVLKDGVPAKRENTVPIACRCKCHDPGSPTKRLL